MFSGWERPSHWLVLAVVVVVLFGYKKLPDASRAVGRSLRIFKTEIKGLNEDEANPTVPPAAEVPVAAPPAPATPTAPAAVVPTPAASTPVVPAAVVPAAVVPAAVAPNAVPPVQPVIMQQPAQLVSNPVPAQPSNS